VRMFNEAELQMLISGSSEGIDVDDLMAHTHYAGVCVCVCVCVCARACVWSGAGCVLGWGVLGACGAKVCSSRPASRATPRHPLSLVTHRTLTSHFRVTRTSHNHTRTHTARRLPRGPPRHPHAVGGSALLHTRGAAAVPKVHHVVQQGGSLNAAARAAVSG
jgi:hypothetical protein